MFQGSFFFQYYNPSRITGTLHENIFTFMKIYRRILLTVRKVPNKSCRKIKTHCLCPVNFSENRAVYEKMSKNLLDPERPQTIWRMRVECWISKATRTKAHAWTVHPHVQPRARTHTNTHRNIQYLLLFHGNSGFASALQWYVVRTLPPR